MRCRLFASFAFAAAGGAAIAMAQTASQPQPTSQPQQPQQQEQQPPTFRSQANLVRVDAYPTHNGQPVLDLKAADFEILEDGKPQSVETFEHVLISPAGPESLRSEPNTIEASRQLIANPKNRVFVLFLDTPHVSVDGAWHAREPLIRMIDRVLGPDDLVGIMTPRMSAADIVLARKTAVIASGLRDVWPWGTRGTLLQDEKEAQYEMCYPSVWQGDIVAQMTARKRERNTLDALRELVLFLRDLREERKAIVTVSEGWLLYRPNSDLVRLRKDPDGHTEPIPAPDPISVGPDGRITTRNRNTYGDFNRPECDNERIYLSQIDDDVYFREIMGEANRANATFYTVDPRGLPVFDTPMGPGAPPPITVDAALLRSRLDSLRVLADNTDGMAVLNSNDLDVGLKRIANDLSSYYLLGYYSTNARLDGKFHTIKVRVKRPGVDVRARKGYISATEAEVAAARTGANAPAPPAAAAATTALSSLSRLRPDWRFSMNAVPLVASGSKSVATVLIEGEVPSGEAGAMWLKGGTITLDVKAGTATATARVPLAAGVRSFSTPVKLSTPVESGSLDVRATLTATDPDAAPFSDILRLDLATSIGQPMLFRRSPSTGNRVVPAGSFQFSRTERVHLEFPIASEARPGAGKLLDKSGQPLTIPVTMGERADAETGQRWLTADIILAALGAGDYVVEVTTNTTGTSQQKVMTAIRVAR